MNKDQKLLQETYELIQIKQFLISEGFSSEEIEHAIIEGKIGDLINKTKRGLAKAGVASTIATSTLGNIGNVKANEVTPYDMAQVIKSGGSTSVGYASPEVRNKINSGSNEVSWNDLLMSGDLFNEVSESDWQEVDKLLNSVYETANKNPSSNEKTAVTILKQIEDNLDKPNKNDQNAQNVIKDIYNKVGEVTKKINDNETSQQKINQQKLFGYVVSEIKSGEKYKKQTVGDWLRTYIIQHIPPKYDKLSNNGYWENDKKLRGM